MLWFISYFTDFLAKLYHTYVCVGKAMCVYRKSHSTYRIYYFHKLLEICTGSFAERHRGNYYTFIYSPSPNKSIESNPKHIHFIMYFLLFIAKYCWWVVGTLVTPSCSDGWKVHTCFAGIGQTGCLAKKNSTHISSLRTGKCFDCSLNLRYLQIKKSVTM